MGNKKFIIEAINLSEKSVEHGGGPFGAVIVRDGKIISRGMNSVTLLNDPTAHAEISAIRAACVTERDFKLTGCDLYTSCEPCPMCLSAAYWAGINRIYFANTRQDAADAGFDDSFIYNQIDLPASDRSIPAEKMDETCATNAFEIWKVKTDKIKY